MTGVSYDNPMRISYAIGSFDYGAAGDASAIPVPSQVGRCRIEDISVMATEVFTTGGKIELGTTGDANRYAELALLTLADTDGLSFDKEVDAFDIGQGGRGVVDIATENITQIELVLTTSTTTGIGFTTIVIAWW